MKSAPKKRSTKAIKLLLVSSAFILQGCRPRHEALPVQALPLDPTLAQSEEQREQQIVGQPNQLQPQTPTNSGTYSRWGYNPFFWGYGSGYGSGYGRSWSSWSSSNSNRSNTGNSGFYSGSGPASHFGAQNSPHSPASHSTSSTASTVHTPTVHAPATHTSTPHSTSSPSVSRGGFGGHGASASS